MTFCLKIDHNQSANTPSCNAVAAPLADVDGDDWQWITLHEFDLMMEAKNHNYLVGGCFNDAIGGRICK